MRYSVSFGGRATYFLFSLVYGPFGFLCLYLLVTRSGEMPLWVRLLDVIFGIGMLSASIYWLYRAFSPGIRFVIEASGFTYYGMFSKIQMSWEDIDKYQLIQGRLGIVNLRLYLKEGLWPRNRRFLDVSGLNPSFRQILVDFEQHLGKPPYDGLDGFPFR